MKPYLFYSIIFTSLILSCFNKHYCQLPEWYNYTCGKNIHSITSDNDNLWIGTNGGMVTIDQNTGEKTFYNGPNTDLPDLYIRSISIDNSGNKWISVSGLGLVKYNDISWEHYTTSNSGLPSNVVTYSVKEDFQGNYWILTNISIVKFDGVNWVNYDYQNSILPQNGIRKFEIDILGHVWVATNSDGLFMFDGINWVAYNTINSSIPGNSIKDIEIDNLGNKWLTIDGVGLVKYDGVTWQTLLHPTFQNTNIQEVEIEGNNKWVLYSGANGGLAKYVNNNWISIPYSQTPYSGMGNMVISPNGKKWFITIENSVLSVLEFDNTNWKTHEVTNSPLKGNNITDIECSSDNVVWISDYGQGNYGGAVVTNKNNTWNSTNMITATYWLTQQSNSEVWVGMFNRIAKFTNGTYTIYDTSNCDIASNRVRDAAVDTIGNMWFSTTEGISHFDGSNWTTYDSTNTPLIDQWINRIIIDNNNKLWAATRWDGVITFDGNNWEIINTSNSGISSNIVNDIAFDSAGNIWFATINKGINIFDGVNWIVYNDTNSPLPINNIREIEIDKYDNAWIGSQAGLTNFDGSIWQQFNISNSGISDNDILSITFDTLDNVWIGTMGGGISVYNPNGLTLEVEELISNSEKSVVYPNPLTSDGVIELPSQITNATFELYDIMGKKIWSLNCENSITKFNRSQLKNGIYIYSISKEGNFIDSGKIIIQ